MHTFMNKTKKHFFTMHHLEDVIHHWPAMSHIQNTAQTLTSTFSLYTLHVPQLKAVHFLIDNPANMASKSNY